MTTSEIAIRDIRTYYQDQPELIRVALKGAEIAARAHRHIEYTSLDTSPQNEEHEYSLAIQGVQ